MPEDGDEDREQQQLEETAAAADKAAGKFTQLGDASHMSFGKLSVAFTGATVAGNALLASLDGLTRALAAPVLELLDAEQAAALLQGTFGGLTGEMQRVADLASKLGANNAFFDDDALAQAGATLKLFGANADAIEQLLPYVNNLAIAFGVDVADAAQLVGQALQGQTRGLARFVPEVKGANSQLEVLAALQASAARNATIAEQRTAGLGGQLALLKRQAADAAQGFGTAMLPALNAVLGFINANMLPALGKLMGALAGLSAYFGNLGKGFSLSDLTRIAGEAILNAEAQFNAVKAAVPAATGARITGIAGGLALPGSFGGGAAAGGGRAAAGPRGVSQYAEPIGPAVPSAMRYESVTEDERVAEAKAKGIKVAKGHGVIFARVEIEGEELKVSTYKDDGGSSLPADAVLTPAGEAMLPVVDRGCNLCGNGDLHPVETAEPAWRPVRTLVRSRLTDRLVGKLGLAWSALCSRTD